MGNYPGGIVDNAQSMNELWAISTKKNTARSRISS